MVARNQVFLDGRFGTAGTEGWTIGLNYAGPAGEVETDPADLGDWAQAIADYLESATLAGLDNLLSSSGRITRVRTYYYSGPGPAVAAGTAALSPARVGSGTASKPPQCSAAFTLLTGLAGRRYRGRFYWPCLAGGFTGDTLKLSIPATAAQDAAAMMNAIGASVPGAVDLNVQVYSAVGDFLTPVNQVRIGDVIDTQRRRREALVEGYITASV